MAPRRFFPPRALTAAAVAALFATSACGTGSGTARSSSTTSTTPAGPDCRPAGNGQTVCVVPGRPLRRRRRRGLLLPMDGGGGRGDEARMEYASVASFAELGLELMALGAPTSLVARCHRAALDEIAHATALGGDGDAFGPIPHLLGRRIGGRFRSRRRHLARVAVGSYRDGWLNEGASATDMAERAQSAAGAGARQAFERIAADEYRHAELGRDVVLWCYDEAPHAVGRALARASS